MKTERTLPPLGVCLTLLLLSSFSPSAHAQLMDSRSDEQVKQATEQAVRIAYSVSPNKGISVRRRKDLEDLLLNVEEHKPVGDVYFYEVAAAPGTTSDFDPTWIVATASSSRGTYELYNFGSAGESDQPLKEFNRLVSNLKLSIPEEQASSFATLFLESCGPGERREVIGDTDNVSFRLAVESYYFAAYGNIWPAMDAYVQWWQGFQSARGFKRATGPAESAGYHIAVDRLVMVEGRHPQIQGLDLEISPRGKVSVVAMQPIFPKSPRWLFYDAPAHVPLQIIP